MHSPVDEWRLSRPSRTQAANVCFRASIKLHVLCFGLTGFWPDPGRSILKIDGDDGSGEGHRLPLESSELLWPRLREVFLSAGSPHCWRAVLEHDHPDRRVGD